MDVKDPNEVVIIASDQKTIERIRKWLIREEKHQLKNKEVYKRNRLKQLKIDDPSVLRNPTRTKRQYPLIDITSQINPELLSQMTQLIVQPAK